MVIHDECRQMFPIHARCRCGGCQAVSHCHSMERSFARFSAAVILLLVAGCDAKDGQRVAALDCKGRDQAICLMVDSIANQLPGLAKREVRLSRSEQVRLDVAAILDGMQGSSARRRA